MPPELLTLNTDQILHILLDGNVEGGQERYILKTVLNRGAQGTLAHSSSPVHATQWCYTEYKLVFTILKKST